VAIIGAGPAGLTAAFELSKHSITGSVFEADSLVGGISRTEEHDGYRFDMGGHRFFSKSDEINALWDEIMFEPMIVRPRLSRIYYGDKFYDYPLKATNALKNMGLFTAMQCMASYAAAMAKPIPEPSNLEEWVINHFGRKLYSMFFKSYTEKVWGISCKEIGADWAAQRIKGLNLAEAIRSSIFGQAKGKVVKTLIDEFRYPRLGPGQLWEACAERVVTGGWALTRDARVTRLMTSNGRVTGVEAVSKGGEHYRVDCSNVLSSMPLRELISCIDSAPEVVKTAASKLAYRDFITVVLVLDAEKLFPDNWMYIHSPEVKLGRIQNFKNWSPALAPDSSKTSLGLEYFCNEGDDTWNSEDSKLIELGYSELKKIGLAGGELVKGYVVRVRKAYPVYDKGYAERIGVVRGYLESIEGLQCIGRNGQHRYNNMDHSMMTALIAARNIATDQRRDCWSVNEDAEYHEK